jgi:peptide deformylase
MGVRKILMLGEASLRTECEWINDPTSKDVGALVADMRDTLEDTFHKTGYGRGIAAPKIGALRRVVFLSSRVLGTELVLVNPKIISHSDEKVTVWDSCLCFLSIFMQVERYKHITLEHYGLSGDRKVIEAGPENDRRV